MNIKKSNTTQDHLDNEETLHEEFNSVEAVESVYPADTIDVIECMDINQAFTGIEQFSSSQKAANDDSTYPDIYSLNSARRAKHDRSLERRASKSQLTDRRSATRLTASGEPQLDRRAENRTANIQAIRQSFGISAANDEKV